MKISIFLSLDDIDFIRVLLAYTAKNTKRPEIEERCKQINNDLARSVNIWKMCCGEDVTNGKDNN